MRATESPALLHTRVEYLYVGAAIALPSPACRIGIVNTKWQCSCENLKEQSPTGHLRPTPQPGRKCQLRPAGGDVVHQMHSCCSSSSRSPESGLQPDGV